MIVEESIGDSLQWNLIDHMNKDSSNAVSSWTCNVNEPDVTDFLIRANVMCPASAGAKYLYLYPNNVSANTRWQKIEYDGTSILPYNQNDAGILLGEYKNNLEGTSFGIYDYTTKFQNAPNTKAHLLIGHRSEHRGDSAFTIVLHGRWITNPATITSFVFAITSGTFYGDIAVYKKAPTW